MSWTKSLSCVRNPVEWHKGIKASCLGGGGFCAITHLSLPSCLPCLCGSDCSHLSDCFHVPLVFTECLIYGSTFLSVALSPTLLLARVCVLRVYGDEPSEAGPGCAPHPTPLHHVWCDCTRLGVGGGGTRVFKEKCTGTAAVRGQAEECTSFCALPALPPCVEWNTVRAPCIPWLRK